MNVATPKIKGGLVLPGMKHNPASSGSSQHSHRIALFNFLPDKVRNHFIAMCGEFAGTFLFLFFAFSGTQVANTNQTGATATGSAAQVPNTSQLLYVALSFGFSLAVNAWVFFRISGGLFNPAVSDPPVLHRTAFSQIKAKAGVFRHVSHWGSTLGTRVVRCHSADPRWNSCGRCRVRPLPGPALGSYKLSVWNFRCSRSLH